jgi:hypothetical protein
MELMSLPTTLIWLSILMLFPAALAAGVVLTGIATFFGRSFATASATRIRAAWMSWRRTVRAVPEPAPSPAVSPVVGVAPAVVRESIAAP